MSRTTSNSSTRYIGVDEAAQIVGVSGRTIRRRISDGTIPARRVGQLLRIKVSDLDAVGTPATITSAGRR